MLRPCACARRISHRAFSTINLPTPSGLNLQTNNLLGEVRDLSTRGQVKEALSLFYTLQPPPHCNQTYATLFHACARHHCIHEGLSLHHYMVAQKPINSPDLFVTNHLINMYAKFGYLEYANQLFDEMPRRNIVSWTALISGYAQRGETENCFRLFAGMLVHYQPNEFAFASILSSCVKSDVGYGRQGFSIVDLELKLFICLYKCTLTGMGLIVPRFLASFLPWAEAMTLMIMGLLSFVFNCTVSPSKLGLH